MAELMSGNNFTFRSAMAKRNVALNLEILIDKNHGSALGDEETINVAVGWNLFKDVAGFLREEVIKPVADFDEDEIVKPIAAYTTDHVARSVMGCNKSLFDIS